MGGWGVSYPNFFWVFIFFLYLQGPLAHFFLLIIIERMFIIVGV